MNVGPHLLLALPRAPSPKPVIPTSKLEEYIDRWDRMQHPRAAQDAAPFMDPQRGAEGASSSSDNGSDHDDNDDDDASVATAAIRRKVATNILDRRASLDGLRSRHVDDHPYLQVLERCVGQRSAWGGAWVWVSLCNLSARPRVLPSCAEYPTPSPHRIVGHNQ